MQFDLMCVPAQAHALRLTINGAKLSSSFSISYQFTWYGTQVCIPSTYGLGPTYHSGGVWCRVVPICFIAFPLWHLLIRRESTVYTWHDVKVIFLFMQDGSGTPSHMRTSRGVATMAWSYLDLLETEFLFITPARIYRRRWRRRWRRWRRYGTIPFSTLHVFDGKCDQAERREEKKVKDFSRFATIDLLLDACDVQAFVVYSWRVFCFSRQITIFSSFSSFFVVVCHLPALLALCHCVKFIASPSATQSLQITMDSKQGMASCDELGQHRSLVFVADVLCQASICCECGVWVVMSDMALSQRFASDTHSQTTDKWKTFLFRFFFAHSLHQFEIMNFFF